MIKRRLRSAAIRPFPLARRLDLIMRIAAQMAARSVEQAERYLQQQLRRQGSVLRRKQIPHQEVERQLRELESAVRARLWHAVLCPPTDAS